jgi:hypothetical protein
MKIISVGRTPIINGTNNMDILLLLKILLKNLNKMNMEVILHKIVGVKQILGMIHFQMKINNLHILLQKIFIKLMDGMIHFQMKFKDLHLLHQMIFINLINGMIHFRMKVKSIGMITIALINPMTILKKSSNKLRMICRLNLVIISHYNRIHLMIKVLMILLMMPNQQKFQMTSKLKKKNEMKMKKEKLLLLL